MITQTKYTDLDIHFTLEQTSFSVLNLVCERFLRSIPKHSHSSNSYEIHYISKGYGSCVLNGKRYAITPNTIYITGPYVEHEQHPLLNDPMVEYCIYVRVEPFKKSDKTQEIVASFLNTPLWFGEDHHQIGTLMESLFDEMESRPLGYQSEVKALLQEIIIKLVRNYQASPKCVLASSSEFIPSTLTEQKYIILEECFLYDYQSLTLTALASRLGLSIRQTERLLKEHYGKTFLQKKNDAIMSAASILLTNSSNSITDIALELGFSTVEHFSNAFRRYYHTSAREYRKSNTERMLPHNTSR